MTEHEAQFRREYAAFQYTDEMRAKILDMLRLVENVMAGTRPVAALENELNARIKGEDEISYGADFLSKWGEFTLRYKPNTAYPHGIEPKSFYFQFGPYLNGVSLTQLESALGLNREPESEAVINWPNFNMHTGKTTDSTSTYQKFLRCGDFYLGITISYNADSMEEVAHPTLLKTIIIDRIPLSSERRKTRDKLFFGDLPKTGDTCQMSGIYVPVFPNEEKFAWVKQATWKNQEYGMAAGYPFQSFPWHNPKTGHTEYEPVYWQFVRKSAV
ncbi:hypothetical protein [Collimonas arenae]|nr:hypothetical protein [Collimonas arenae]